MKVFHVLIACFFALVLFYCGGEAGANNASGGKEGCEIKGEIVGLNEPYVRFFGHLFGNNYFIDSIPVQNGKFTIKSDTSYPGGIYYIVGANDVVSLFLDKNQYFSFKGNSGDLTRSLVFDGSLDNQLFYKNLIFEEDYQDQLNQINTNLELATPGSPEATQLEQQRDDLVAQREAHLDEFFTKHPSSIFSVFKKAGQNPTLRDIKLPDGSKDEGSQVYWYRNDFWESVDFNESRLLRTPVVTTKIDRFLTKLTVQNADSMIAAVDPVIQKTLSNREAFKLVVNYIGNYFKEPKFMGSDAVYVHLIQNYFTYDLAFWASLG